MSDRKDTRARQPIQKIGLVDFATRQERDPISERASFYESKISYFPRLPGNIWVESRIGECNFRQMIQLNDRGALDHVSRLVETDRALVHCRLEFCNNSTCMVKP